MRIDRMDYAVVGVANQSFTGTEVDPVDVWLPLEAAVLARADGDRLHDDGLSWLQVVGRLAPGATLTASRSEADVIARRFDTMHPGQRTLVHVSEAAALDAGLLHSSDRSKVLGVGAGVALFGLILLLICTSNAAALLLARAVARQQEVAIRIAIGAGRRRIVQQLFAESIVIALAAAAVGLAFCTALFRTAAHALPLPEYFGAFVPGGTTLTFATAFAVGAALLFGLAPAIIATRVDPLPMLKQGAISSGQRLPASRLRHTLVAMQMAVSLVLLVASALLGRGVERALRVDIGFSVSNLYAITVDVPQGASSAQDRAVLVRRLSAMLQSSAGSADAGLAMVPPFSGKGFSSARTQHMSAPLQLQFNSVDSGYFRALRVSPVAGRIFDARRDRDAVVVNARLARAFWGDERAALGQPLEILEEERSVPSDGASSSLREPQPVYRVGIVVGVVPTLQSTDIGIPDGPTIYLPIDTDSITRACLIVRSTSRQSLTRMVDDVIGKSDAAGAVVAIEERLASRTGPARIAAVIAGLVGMLALLMAGVGVYGIVAHSVIARTHEIGVHIALGAPHPRVMRLVLGSSLRAVAAGATLGALVVTGVAALASRTLEPILFGVRPLDPLALGAAIAVLAILTVPAAYIPARRALGTGPLEALRHV
jgi:predicted permease